MAFLAKNPDASTDTRPLEPRRFFAISPTARPLLTGPGSPETDKSSSRGHMKLRRIEASSVVLVAMCFTCPPAHASPTATIGEVSPETTPSATTIDEAETTPSATTTEEAAPNAETTDSAARFENPFQSYYDEGPAWLRVGLRMGSVHRDGIGPTVGVSPWDYLRLDATYGYRTQHSFAALVTVPIFPRALLTPYVTAGYALGMAALPQGIRLFSHQLVGGLGMEARVFERYVVGAEATTNWIFRQSLQDKADTHLLQPGVPLSVHGGFHVGVHLP